MAKGWVLWLSTNTNPKWLACLEKAAAGTSYTVVKHRLPAFSINHCIGLVWTTCIEGLPLLDGVYPSLLVVHGSDLGQMCKYGGCKAPFPWSKGTNQYQVEYLDQTVVFKGVVIPAVLIPDASYQVDPLWFDPVLRAVPTPVKSQLLPKLVLPDRPGFVGQIGRDDLALWHIEVYGDRTAEFFYVNTVSGETVVSERVRVPPAEVVFWPAAAPTDLAAIGKVGSLDGAVLLAHDVPAGEPLLSVTIDDWFNLRTLLYRVRDNSPKARPFFVNGPTPEVALLRAHGLAFGVKPIHFRIARLELGRVAQATGLPFITTIEVYDESGSRPSAVFDGFSLPEFVAYWRKFQPHFVRVRASDLALLELLLAQTFVDAVKWSFPFIRVDPETDVLQMIKLTNLVEGVSFKAVVEIMSTKGHRGIMTLFTSLWSMTDRNLCLPALLEDFALEKKGGKREMLVEPTIYGYVSDYDIKQAYIMILILGNYCPSVSLDRRLELPLGPLPRLAKALLQIENAALAAGDTPLRTVSKLLRTLSYAFTSLFAGDHANAITAECRRLLDLLRASAGASIILRDTDGMVCHSAVTQDLLARAKEVLPEGIHLAVKRKYERLLVLNSTTWIGVEESNGFEVVSKGTLATRPSEPMLIRSFEGALGWSIMAKSMGYKNDPPEILLNYYVAALATADLDQLACSQVIAADSAQEARDLWKAQAFTLPATTNPRESVFYHCKHNARQSTIKRHSPNEVWSIDRDKYRAMLQSVYERLVPFYGAEVICK